MLVVVSLTHTTYVKMPKVLFVCPTNDKLQGKKVQHSINYFRILLIIQLTNYFSKKLKTVQKATDFFN